jgi:hypothetical protein
MSDTKFWTYVIPYVDVSIASDTQLIAGNNFDIVNRILWLQFNSFYIDDVADALGGQPESSITGQLNEDNEFCSYDLIYNEDGNRGSFPYKIVGHSTQTDWNSNIDQSNKYMGIASLGNIDMPFFRDITKITEIVTGSESVSVDEDDGVGIGATTSESNIVTGAQVKEIGDISFSYSYDLEAFYRGEETLIKENWQQYTSEKSEYSGFNDAYDGYVNDLISNSYVESNSDQKFFVFQKTTKPINLSYMSTLPDPVIDDVVSTAATTTTSDTVITTSGFTEAGSAIIEASNPVVNTDTGGLASGGSAGGYS